MFKQHLQIRSKRNKSHTIASEYKNVNEENKMFIKTKNHSEQRETQQKQDG